MQSIQESVADFVDRRNRIFGEFLLQVEVQTVFLPCPYNPFSRLLCLRLVQNSVMGLGNKLLLEEWLDRSCTSALNTYPRAPHREHLQHLLPLRAHSIATPSLSSA